MERHYVITIGEVTRQGSEQVLDAFLFPASMSATETNQAVERLLDEAEQDERDDGGAG